MNIGLFFSSSQGKHHQFSKPHVYRQGMQALKLLDALKLLELGLENKEYGQIKNFVTGKVFPQEASL